MRVDRRCDSAVRCGATAECVTNARNRRPRSKKKHTPTALFRFVSFARVCHAMPCHAIHYTVSLQWHGIARAWQATRVCRTERTAIEDWSGWMASFPLVRTIRLESNPGILFFRVPCQVTVSRQHIATQAKICNVVQTPWAGSQHREICVCVRACVHRKVRSIPVAALEERINQSIVAKRRARCSRYNKQ